LAQAELVVLAAPLQSRAAVETLVGRFGTLAWRPQPHRIMQFQSQLSFAATENQVLQLCSDLARLPVSFECELRGEQEFSRILHVPGLGLATAQLDAAGEQVLRAGAIAEAVKAADSLRELESAIRRLTLTAWDDQLEELRKPTVATLLARPAS
jgi:hypothetical protein